MLLANLACTIPWWQLELEGIKMNRELSKGIEFYVSRMAEDVPIKLNFLIFLVSVGTDEIALTLVY